MRAAVPFLVALLLAQTPSVADDQTPLPAEARPMPLARPAWIAHVHAMDRELAAADLRRVGVLMLGDSVVQNWPAPLAAALFGTTVFNAGIGGDTTASLLWRLPRLPLGTALRPRTILLLIGTNDLHPGVQPRDVVAGVAGIVRVLHARAPSSRVLVIGLLPRGRTTADPLRNLANAVDRLLSTCRFGPYTRYEAPGAVLLDDRGLLALAMSKDALHPTAAGYGRLTRALASTRQPP